MLTLASSVRGLAPAIAPTPHADGFFGSASTATAGHWSGVAREAVLSGDRRVIRLDGLLSPSEAAALLAAARDSTFDEENATVDDAAPFLAPLIASVVALCGAHTVAILATEERGTHRLLHAALRRAFRRVEFVRRSTARRCLARAAVDTAPADGVAVAVGRGVR